MAAIKALKLSYPPLIFEIEIFLSSNVYDIKEYNKTHENCIRHHPHDKFKMTAIKSLILPYLPHFFHKTVRFRYQ